MAGTKARHADNFDIGRSGGGGGRQDGGGFGNEIGAVAAGVEAVWEAADAGIGRTGGSGRPEAAGQAGRGHVAATQSRSGAGLVALSSPRVDECAEIEAVDDQSGGVAQHHVAGPVGDDDSVVGKGAGEEGGSSEPLVGFGLALVAGDGDLGVAHNGVDGMVFGQGAIESDAGSKRLDGLVAGVGEGCRRLEADAGSAIAEGKVGGMAELEWGGQIEARAQGYYRFAGGMRTSEGRSEVDACAGWT